MTSSAIAPRASGLKLAAPSNQKLGIGIHSFSLPAEETCPGSTETCRLLCYAKQGHFHQPNVKRRYEANYRASLLPDFADQMVAAVRSSYARIVRVHASGDFYSAAYAEAWIAVAARCRGTDFFWYTRSWRNPAILPALSAMAAMPNVFGWWSEDRDTGPSPATPGARVAFMVDSVADEALVDGRASIVFRTRGHKAKTGHALKRIAERLVCPVEQGVKRSVPITCSTCRICFTSRQAPLSIGPSDRREGGERLVAQAGPVLGGLGPRPDPAGGGEPVEPGRVVPRKRWEHLSRLLAIDQVAR